jgi:hypothetical protein
MQKVFIGLGSHEGDRIGHLVRAVQMLRSYGKETKVVRYFDVLSEPANERKPQGLFTVLEFVSEATDAGLQGICKETEWSLGDHPETLNVLLLEKRRREPIADPFEALLVGKVDDRFTLFTDAVAFAKLCDWGQRRGGEGTDVMGEWPSATGR